MVDSSLWKSTIISALKKRDLVQKNYFSELFDKYYKNRLVYLSTENTRLDRELSICRQENLEIQLKLEKANALKSYDYEQKVFQMQEEVTDLHRQKGSLAENVIELNKVVQEKDKQILSGNMKISELDNVLKDAQKSNYKLLEQVKYLNGLKDVLTDEQASSLLALKAMESKSKQLEDDNVQLIRRMKVLQDTIEKLKNIEKHQEIIRKNLEDAANSVINVSESGLEGLLLPCRSSLPCTVLARVDANEGDVNCVRFTPSGHLFGSAGFDRKLRLWTVYHGKCELHSTLIGCNGNLNAIDFDPNETSVLGASSDFSCRIWTLSDSRLRVNLTGHSERVISAKFMGSTDRVITVSSDRTIKFWDANKCLCKRTIMVGSASQDVVYSTTLGAVISGHFDHNVRVWDERSGVNINETKLSGRVTGLDICSDMSSVLACTRNNTLEIINLRMNRVVQCFKMDEFNVGSDIVRPCFSPDFKYVAAGGQDGGVYIWNISSGKLETCLRDHGNVVVCCHWNPVGNSFVSCERTRKAVVWGN